MVDININTIGTEQGGKSFDNGIAPAGPAYVRLIQIVDMGVQPRPPYKGTEKKPCRQIEMLFELIGQTISYEKDGETCHLPRWISSGALNVFKTLQENSNLYKYVTGMDPSGATGGNLSAMLGAAFTANIVHGTYVQGPNAGQPKAAIGSISAIIAGTQVADALSPLVSFSYDAPTVDAYVKLPEWKRNQLKKAVNFQGSLVQGVAATGDAQLASQSNTQAQAVAQPVTAQVAPAQPAPVTQPAPPVAPMLDEDIPF